MIKILIVDDEKPICDLIDLNLSAAGYFCKSVQDGMKAIYYQRTAGFEKDTDFTEDYECTEEDTLEALVTKIRAYWGWQT